MSRRITFFLPLVIPMTLSAQQKDKINFEGQLSVWGSYAPNNRLEFLLGGRYLPAVSYVLPLDSTKKMDIFVGANIFGNVAFHAFDTSNVAGNIRPYRLWGRFSTQQLEVRLGLQKIDFGAASIFRPLQWFNRVDPRDPLGVTDGVYAALGRYYFLNNANIWFWVLYGNENTKGFETIGTNQDIPEVGGRVQYPIPRGELGLSYHYRTASSDSTAWFPRYEKIPESKYGLDVKLDLAVGVWLEASYVRKSNDLNVYTQQTFINVGVDYTFKIGSGLYVAAEHLLVAFDKKAFAFQRPVNVTAIILTYPFGIFDDLTAVATYDWTRATGSVFLNYKHQFNKLTGYLMFFYNPETPTGLFQNEAGYSTTGPGVRIMVVYNH